MNKYISNAIYALVLISLTSLTFSCSDDDDNTPELIFPGAYTIISAETVTSGEDILLELGGLLLADSPCDTTGNPANAPLIELAAGSSNTSGNINIICTASAATQSNGTWVFSEANGTFTLNLPVPGSPVPIPIALTNLEITANSSGTVTLIEGEVNLSAFASQLPELDEPVALTIIRVQ
ncbi:MAG: hypothetical protein NW226_01150 [Microscillaceae bacterium]|nr:hypothetical protein [Microscillaceae bacterium]